SFNTGVNYHRQLRRSVDREEVEALYQQAGLSLDDDLDTLEQTARISADPNALNYLSQNIIFNGQIHIPVLTMHTSGDGLVAVQNETAYRKVVDEADNEEFLREIFVHRAGHCAFTPAETLTALERLINRMDTGEWHGLAADDLNDTAEGFGPLNVAPPAFFRLHPGPFLRPFDAAPEDPED
ncbi:MAG TPA: hypothetical protein VEW69_00400, partial [Alphaproteobacteria bacterium]|nr:hypothetical protein [Alphaproteobacteria bacterium]